jgi:hypothetical protein
MPGSKRDRLSKFRIGAFALCVAAALVPAGTANAQNLLESLFGARPSRAPVPVSASAADPRAWDFLDRAKMKREAAANEPREARETKSSGCASTCKVGPLDVMDDPTLRRGDLVVTRNGPLVFTGASRTKNRDRAFVPAADYPGLPKSMRQELAGMRIAKVPNEMASLPAGATPATLIPPAALTYAPVEPTPIVEAFASFER